MTAHDDLDKQLSAFLREGPTDLPDPSFDAVRDRTESTRQRVVLGPWRVPDMNKFLAVGLAAAAVVVLLVVGTNLLGSSGNPPGGAPSESAAPSEAPSEPASSAPQSPSEVSVTYDGPIPAGWTQDSNGSVPYPDDENLVFLVTQNELVQDPGCAARPDSDVGPSAGEAVEALAGREGLEETAVTSAVVSGLDGHQLDFVAAADGTGATCHDASEGLDFVPLFGHYDAAFGGRFLYSYAGPGEVNRLIVLDTAAGGTVWIWAYAAATVDPTDHFETAMEVVNGLQFESP
jgi:hypothetical protein